MPMSAVSMCAGLLQIDLSTHVCARIDRRRLRLRRLYLAVDLICAVCDHNRRIEFIVVLDGEYLRLFERRTSRLAEPEDVELGEVVGVGLCIPSGCEIHVDVGNAMHCKDMVW